MTGTIRIGHDDQLLRCHVPHEPVQYIVANPQTAFESHLAKARGDGLAGGSVADRLRAGGRDRPVLPGMRGHGPGSFLMASPVRAYARRAARRAPAGADQTL